MNPHLSLPVRIVVAFVPGIVTLGLAAGLVGNAVQAAYFPTLASPDGQPSLLLGGAALQAVLLALIFPAFRLDAERPWLLQALGLAVPLGLLVYFSTHVVQAGYIEVSTTGWLLEGLYDSLSIMASVTALVLATRRWGR